MELRKELCELKCTILFIMLNKTQIYFQPIIRVCTCSRSHCQYPVSAIVKKLPKPAFIIQSLFRCLHGVFQRFRNYLDHDIIF